MGFPFGIETFQKETVHGWTAESEEDGLPVWD